MLEAVLSGISLGLVLALLVGPVFFMLIDTSIKKGFMKAVILAVGVVLSDAFFICLTYFSATALGFMKSYQTEIGIAGGILLVIFGLVNIFKKPHLKSTDIDLPDNSKSPLVDIVKGFMMNALNPFVLIFWIGVSGVVSANENYSDMHIVMFYLVVLLTVFLTDVLKAWLAARLRHFLKPGLILMINRVSGVGLILFGCRLLYQILFP
jgi:amino acid exporter